MIALLLLLPTLLIDEYLACLLKQPYAVLPLRLIALHGLRLISASWNGGCHKIGRGGAASRVEEKRLDARMLLVGQCGEGKGWSAMGMVRVVTREICGLVSGFVPERVIQV